VRAARADRSAAALRRLAFLAFWALVAALTGPEAAGWGTTSSSIPLGSVERYLIDTLARSYTNEADRERFTRELSTRLSSHPTHQFIVAKAWLLVASDPAFSGSGFPTLDCINVWDGNKRGDAGGQKDDAPQLQGVLAPRPEGMGSVVLDGGADAEVTLQGVWNSDYQAIAHYYNPWLNLGIAPAAAGVQYEAAVARIAQPDPGTPSEQDLRKGRSLHYLAHYVADPVTAKHADAILVRDPVLGQLKRQADAFVAIVAANNDEPKVWVDSQPVTDALALLREDSALHATSRDAAEAWWRRVEGHIAADTLLPQTSGYFQQVDVEPRSLRSSIAAYLNYVGNRTQDVKQAPKPLRQFYTFYDPFYFNGELINPAGASAKFDLATPFSTHMAWETQPALRNFAVDDAATGSLAGIRARTLIRTPEGQPPDRDYRSFRFAGSARDTYAAKHGTAGPLNEAMAEFVRGASGESHGPLDDARDFDNNPDRSLGLAIRSVATAFRASFTGLRCDAEIMTVNDRWVVRGRLYNRATQPATVEAVRLGWQPATLNLAVTPKQEQLLEGVVLPAQSQPEDGPEVTWEIARPPGTEPPPFTIDIFGRYPERLPDCGWRHEPVKQGIHIVAGTAAYADKVRSLAAKTPVDVVLVLDVTLSMSSTMAALKQQLAELTRQLKERSGSLQVGLVWYRDYWVERGTAVDTAGMSDNVDKMLSALTDLTADGGEGPLDLQELDPMERINWELHQKEVDGHFVSAGMRRREDIGQDKGRESQLQGIKLAIAMWRHPQMGRPNPVKLVVVVTDEGAHEPDYPHLTKELIQYEAKEVDPAHVYPVVVGSSPIALADAAEIARMTRGRVVNPKDPAGVVDAIVQAVDLGIEDHAPRPPGPGVCYGFMGGGVLLVLCGVGLLFRRRDPREDGGDDSGDRCPNPDCGQPAPRGKAFCPRCGTPLKRA